MRVKRLVVIAWAAMVVPVVFVGCSGEEAQRSTGEVAASEGYTGSESCRECHERFYELWAPSHHGLAMQPFSPEFARGELEPTLIDVTIGDTRFGVTFEDDGGWMHERGRDGAKKYAIEQVLGGKNVYYFLTPRERGRLQVLPLAYDVRRHEWFDATASMVRHFADMEDSPVHWTDRLLTFNSSCYNCHVSQLSTNYDPRTDSYRTVWAEPGINCETCHGPAEEHIRVFREAPEGFAPADTAIIRVKGFTVEQTNDACAPCHAKMYPITDSFQPGDRYFDHYGLITLEHPDFYPDGRDLGENYTYTLWLMSPCLSSGQLDCLHCHTSSGRYRFVDEPNRACAPCHQDKVDDPTVHTHHAEGSEGSQCVACHMPKTVFARMTRSDHSMRPPTPATTLEFGSPNACNLCHTDRDAAWSDRWVREWRARDYQAPVLYRARLIDAARKGDWTRLPEMLEYLADPGENEVYRASLVRLLMASGDERKWSASTRALDDPSPLVRASAAQALTDHYDPDATRSLLVATRDEYRLVRVSAASALAGLDPEQVPDAYEDDLASATAEFVAALEARPDHWSSHFNLGYFYMRRGEFDRAIASFERAHRLEPRVTAPLINAAIVYGLMGEDARAEEALLRALEADPEDAAANLNLGLLLAGQGRTRDAEQALRAVMATEPNAVAAYNLCVIAAADRLDEAIEWCRRAVELEPSEPQYVYTLAFYLRRRGDTESAVSLLTALIGQRPGYGAAYVLLSDIYESQGRADEAEAVFERALSSESLSSQDRYGIEAKLRAMRSKQKGDS